MTTVKLAPAFHGKISFQSVVEAQERIKGFLHTTPVFQNEALNRLCIKEGINESAIKVFCKGGPDHEGKFSQFYSLTR